MEETETKFEKWHDKNYKKILLIPGIVLFLAFAYLLIFYFQTGDIINKDVSLAGGTTITIFTETSAQELESSLSAQFPDLIIRTISDNTGKQTKLIVTVPNSPEEISPAIEQALGFQLTEENSSTEFTGAALSEDFYKQLVVAVVLAFFWMSGIVFIIFTKGAKTKFWVIILNIIFGIMIGNIFNKYGIISIFSVIALMGLLIYIYIKNSVPSFAVMFCAFSDIVMTLALVNLLGIKLSTAGIVSFLMLIGYSVDTDVLLTTRVLKRKYSINKAILSAFKTGVTMSLTSMIAVLSALIVVFSFGTVLNQIFIILAIGLFFDILNTWLTNVSIIKWYAITRQ